MHVKSIKAQCLLFGIMGCGTLERNLQAQMPSSSLDRGPKLQSWSIRALMLLHSATLKIFLSLLLDILVSRGEIFILVLKMLFGRNLDHHKLHGPKTVISASNCPKSNLVSGSLDLKFGHISDCLDTIKCALSTALQRLFGPKVWSYQSLPGFQQVCLQHCTSLAV
ncbi:hypothetical protein TNCV_3748241 [Trichonephila clavipes]|nr:hypothetical protein TNCV_3748241 [Trichonephila clavipes]